MAILSWFRSPRVKKYARWILHILIVCTILVLLWYLNRSPQIRQSLSSSVPWLHPFWLPLIFILLYTIVWLTIILFRLINEDPLAGRDPELEQAWERVKQSLLRNRIDFQNTPIIVSLGQPSQGWDHFIQATQIPALVSEKHHPLQVHANPEMIFIHPAEGASVLATWIASSTNKTVPDDTEISTNSTEVIANEELLNPSIAAEETPKTTSHTGSDAFERLPRPLDKSTQQLTEKTIAENSTRLTMLGALLRRDRRPLCPINGVLWMLPAEPFFDSENNSEWEIAGKEDMLALQRGTFLDCAMSVALVDADRLNGMTKLFEQTRLDLLENRLLGRGIPLVPNIPAQDRIELVKSLWKSVTNSLMSGMVYQRMSELENAKECEAIWQLMQMLREREENIVRWTNQALFSRTDKSPMLSGIYLSGTGNDRKNQYFAKGIILDLLKHQNAVAWSEEAKDQEKTYVNAARVGYLAIGILAIATLYTIWKLYSQ